MSSAPHNLPHLLHALLVLGRVSNLPTIWSNCLAGWLMGGAGTTGQLLRLCFGASCLYIGGMFLNDAFDVSFDRVHRPERPIPSKQISEQSVWAIGFGLLGVGWLCLAGMGASVHITVILLVICILLYDAIHKAISFAPAIMAFCRFLVIVLGAAAGVDGIDGLSIWSAIFLGLYVGGLTSLARSECGTIKIRHWPLALLAAPILLATLVNDMEFVQRGVLMSVVFALWLFRSLRPVFRHEFKDVGASVASLLAGIVLVDLLAVVGIQGQFAQYIVVFPFLFILTLILQKFVPAT